MKAAILALAILARDASVLDVRVTPLTPAVGSAVIVGRAVCGASTWLLTRQAELIQIVHVSDRVSTHRVHDLRPDDPFWGLACLDDGSLWTLATPHVIARLSADGAILERQALRLPHVELFGFRERLMFLSLPIVNGRSVLATGTRREPEDVRPWVGLIGRAAVGSSLRLAINFVGCGIATSGGIPCWFGDQAQISIGDGTVARTVSPPSLNALGIDQTAPIRDVALVAGGAMWVLAASSSSAGGRRVGERLIRLDAAGVEVQSYTFTPAARLIVHADASSCTLLTTDGALMRVTDGR